MRCRGKAEGESMLLRALGWPGHFSRVLTPLGPVWDNVSPWDIHGQEGGHRAGTASHGSHSGPWPPFLSLDTFRFTSSC